MRIIKFRGLRVEGGGWVFGSYLHEYFSTAYGENINAIVNRRDGIQKRDRIIPESLGQFTGLHDANSKEIFEGDLVNIPYNRIGNVVVAFENGAFNITKYRYDLSEVIGNIYENAGLLNEK